MRKFNANLSDWAAVGFILFVFGVIFGGAIGYIMNIIVLLNDNTLQGAEFILRGFGVVFAPLGAIMGYL